MSNTPLLNIIVLQDGHTPIDVAKIYLQLNCFRILHPHYLNVLN